MRKEFKKTIKTLELEMLEMASKAEQSIEKAMKSLVKRDLELAKKVIEEDNIIDKYEKDIESHIIKLLTLQKPVARDFRKVASVFKIITDLERIGDLSSNIAEISLSIGKEDFIKPLVDLPKMYKITKEMLSDSLKAFVNRDILLAQEIRKKDDIVDKLNLDINEELLLMISKNEKFIDQAMKLMFISRYLERIADHVTNICERVVYIETNEMTNKKN